MNSMIPAEIFREYDIRGLVGQQLNVPLMERLGQAFGTYLLRHQCHEAVVGHDNRLSSPDFSAAVIAGLRRSGVNVVNIGMVTTPIFYYSRVLWQIDGGVMVTGSHNPADQNGLKLALGAGTIYGEAIQQLQELARSGALASGQGTLRQADPVPDYQAMLQTKIQLGPRPLKVVADAGNGTASLFVVDFLTRLGVEVEPLYCTSDPTYPHHHPDPVDPRNLVDLIARVKEVGADVGLSFDGDSDRLGAVDEKGQVLWGDTLMALFWREVLAHHPGAPAIIEIKCSQALVDEVERLGGKPVLWKTGHSLIKAKMRELDAPFTGEMSGHLFFRDEYFGFDDAFYAAGRLLRILSHEQRPLSALTADLPRYVATPEIRLDCADDRKFTVVEQLREAFAKRYPIIDVDGVRVLFPGGWGLVRASNTQAVLVVRAEGKTDQDLAAIVGELNAALAPYGLGPLP